MPRTLSTQGLDEIGKRRCLMILDVLSGRVPVTEAIATAKISRGTYYQLETKALAAMLCALSPSSTDSSTSASNKEVATLEARVKKLEVDKRRLERLLQLATKVVKQGPLTTGKGRQPRSRRSSTKSGPPASTASAKTEKPVKLVTPRSTPKPSGNEP